MIVDQKNHDKVKQRLDLILTNEIKYLSINVYFLYIYQTSN